MNQIYVPIQSTNFCDSYKNFILSPTHPLYGIVIEFYELDTSELNNAKMICFPDACVDIMFLYNNTKQTGYILGSFKELSYHHLEENSKLFGVRFASGSFFQMCNIPASDFLSEKLSLKQIFTCEDQIIDMLKNANGFKERVNIITNFLYPGIARSENTPPIIKHILNKIITSNGNIRCKSLAEQAGYSDRQLRNLMHKYVGLSPKLLCEIIQFQQSVQLFSRQSNNSNENISSESNYYDASHMNKAYYQLTGLSPKKFINRYCLK